MRVAVHVTPRARRNGFGGLDSEGRLRMAVTAPPAHGQANAAASDVLANALGVGIRSLRLVSGARSRVKVFEILDSSPEVARRLAVLVATQSPSPNAPSGVQ